MLLGHAGWEISTMSEAADEPGIKGGHHELDSEHQFQVGLVTAMQYALRAGRPRDDVRPILDQLTGFTDVHFMAEQLLMRLYAYPGYAEHQDEHDRLVGELAALRDAFDGGDDEATHRRLDGLRAALLAHIRSSDQALGAYVMAREPADRGQ